MARPVSIKVGDTFARLTVLKRLENKGHNTNWLCRCSCVAQTELAVLGPYLKYGETKSCGCLAREVNVNRFRTHGLSHTKEYRLLKDARKRAKEFGREFDLEYQDIVIPAECPILKIPIIYADEGKPTNNSPSLDRIDSSKGYIKGNVRVISMRANRLKQDSSIEELERIIAYMRGEI